MADATAPLPSLLSTPSSAQLWRSSLLLLLKCQIQLSNEEGNKKQMTFQTALDERWVVLSTNVAINSAQKVLEKHGMFIRVSIKISTHAEVVCISCQLLLKFCFSSFIRLMPSFCLISTRCFSLAASTCRKVEISSSS